MTANDEIYGDVLDNLEEIRPDVREENTRRSYVTEPFDTDPWDIFFMIRIRNFMDNVPEGKRAYAASAIASFITELFTDASLQTETSPVYVYGKSEEFAGESFLFKTPIYHEIVTFCFGVSFGRGLTIRQRIRLLVRLDAVSAFVNREFRFSSDIKLCDSACITLFNYSEKPILISNVATRTITVRKYIESVTDGRIRAEKLREILTVMPAMRTSINEQANRNSGNSFKDSKPAHFEPDDPASYMKYFNI
jgi:hypothetical protein